MALLLSEDQLARVFRDGMLALSPSFTVEGEIRYSHVCNGEPFARVHVNTPGAATAESAWCGRKDENVLVGPYIVKIDALRHVEFYPSFVYNTVGQMLAGDMETITQHVMRLILRPVQTVSSMSKREQYMHGGTVKPELASRVFDSIVVGDSELVKLACVQPYGCNDSIQSILDSREMDSDQLYAELRSKWT